MREGDDSFPRITRRWSSDDQTVHCCQRHSRRIEEYERVTRKFRLKTTLSSLSLLLDAKSFQASAGAGLVAGLFGGPLVGLSAAVAIEIGKIAVNISEKHHDLRDWQSGHELAFIFGTKKVLS